MLLELTLCRSLFGVSLKELNLSIYFWGLSKRNTLFAVNCLGYINNNNNRYLERLTRTGPKRLYIL